MLSAPDTPLAPLKGGFYFKFPCQIHIIFTSYAVELVPTLRVGMQPGRSASAPGQTAHSGSARRGTFPRGAWEREPNCVTPIFFNKLEKFEIFVYHDSESDDVVHLKLNRYSACSYRISFDFI
jgi:hypothetical protein